MNQPFHRNEIEANGPLVRRFARDDQKTTPIKRVPQKPAVQKPSTQKPSTQKPAKQKPG